MVFKEVKLFLNEVDKFSGYVQKKVRHANRGDGGANVPFPLCVLPLPGASGNDHEDVLMERTGAQKGSPVNTGRVGRVISRLIGRCISAGCGYIGSIHHIGPGSVGEREI